MNGNNYSRLRITLLLIGSAWLLTFLGAVQLKTSFNNHQIARYEKNRAFFQSHPDHPYWKKNSWFSGNSTFPSLEEARSKGYYTVKKNVIPVFPFIILSHGTSSIAGEDALYLWHLNGCTKFLVFKTWIV